MKSLVALFTPNTFWAFRSRRNEIIRMSEAPEVEVHIVKSTDKIGGIGELGVPALAPAVANAVFNATGARIRRIPLTPSVVQEALKKA